MGTKPFEVIHGGQAADAGTAALTDDALMLLARRDHHAAFAELTRRHQPCVTAYAARYLGDSVAAREVTQEVFLTVWADRARYSGKDRFRSYLLVIATNRCRTYAKRNRAEQGRQACVQSLAPAVVAADDQLPLSQLIEVERRREVQRRLRDLNRKTREVLLLRFASELSYEEIAEVTGRPMGTVKSLVSRGLKQLHLALHKELCG